VREFKTMITWRGVGVDRLEQVRLHVSGLRIKAYGRIISAATADSEAFSASYELITNDAGVTKRLSIHLLRESGESQLGLSHDDENLWLVRTNGDTTIRSDFDGAQDVDLAMSPMFNALPIRRFGLATAPNDIEIPVAYVYLPTGEVKPAHMHYTSGPDGIDVVSPVATAKITVDENGFVVNYEGLAERV